MFFLFPAIIALFARYVGKLFRQRARIPIAALVAILYLLLGIEAQLNFLWFIVLPVPVGIAYTLSGIRLTRLQSFSVIEYKAKRFNIDCRKPFETPLYVTSLFVIPILIIGLLKHLDSACQLNIEEKDHEQILATCIHDEKLSWNKLHLNNYYIKEHEFGQHFNLSKEGMLVKTAATSNDPDFQFLWWFILRHIYQYDYNPGNKEAREQVTNIAEQWLTKAAKNGSILAMKTYIFRHLNADLSTKKQKDLAIKYAKIIGESNRSEAEKLLMQSQEKTTIEDIQKDYQYQLADYKSLSIDKLENLIYAQEEGFFYYRLSDYTHNPEHNYEDSIQVKVEPNKALELLVYLSEEHNNANASYKLYQTLSPTNRNKANEYLSLAATQNHPVATEKYGVHLYCNNDLLNARLWLRKAATLGNKNASQILTQLAKGHRVHICKK